MSGSSMSRPLQIPCDALPGEYPLVLSIYDPKVLLQEQGPLPLIQADGSAGDTLALPDHALRQLTFAPHARRPA